MLFIALFILGIIIIVKIYISKQKQEYTNNENAIKHEKQQEKYINYKNYINENSVALQKLRELNQKYMFYPNENFDKFYSYDNQQYFDTISCKDYLIYQLQYEQTKIRKQIGKIDFNIKHKQKYNNEIQLIQVFGKYKNPNTLLDENLLLELEQKLFYSEIQKPPVCLKISVTLVLTNISGEHIMKKSDLFYQEQILKWIEQINNKTGNFYNNKEIWDSICRVERGKVSNKMRFSIYERDGYRCKCCHRQFEENELEIDHIKAIAEGGKSIETNLQTLCRDCNRTKGSRHIRYY